MVVKNDINSKFTWFLFLNHYIHINIYLLTICTMYWYRVVKTKDGQYGLAEVYMNEDWKPYKRSIFINGVYDSYLWVIHELQVMLSNIESHEPIDDLPCNNIDE